MIRGHYAGLTGSHGLGLKMLTDDEVDRIHAATLEVLQRTGVFVEDETAREVLHGGGAAVDAKTGVVRMAPHLVEDAVRSAPAKFVACGRTPEKDVVLESSRVTFTNFGEGIVIRDMHTGELRDRTIYDLAGERRWLVDRDALLDLRGNVIGYLGEQTPPEVL